jgi:hypothetical protein
LSRADGRRHGAYGRLPERPEDFAVPFIHELATSPFPPLLSSVAVPAVADWGMDGNDRYGDCVIACLAHAMAAWDVEVTEADGIPNEADCIAEYDALTGCKEPGDAHDTGLQIGPVLQKWVKPGLFGPSLPSTVTAVAKVSLTTPGMLRQAIACYGGVIAGFNMPSTAAGQFDNDEPWTYVAGSPIVDGHCVLLVGYDGIWIDAVTWGTTTRIGPRFLEHYMDVAWVAIPTQFVQAGRGPELNLAALQADLPDLNP